MNLDYNKKINVMHIRDSKGIYGAERVILTLGHNIDEKNFNFILLCMRHNDGKSKTLIDRAKKIGIQVLVVDVNGKIDFSSVLKIRSIIKENSINIIHTHDYKSDIYSLLASFRMNIKRIATAHGSTRDSMVKRIYLFITEQVAYRFFTKIIAVSKAVSHDLIKKHLKPEKIEVIQNGIDISIINNGNDNSKKLNGLTNNSKVFAVIGRLFPDKGHRFFLQAFQKLTESNSGIFGLILGDGPSREEIKKQIRKLEIEEYITVSGFRSDMKTVYELIDFLVIPSLREGLPYVLLEAMILKIPVIGTTVGDIPLIIKDQISGYLVAPGDVESLKGVWRTC